MIDHEWLPGDFVQLDARWTSLKVAVWASVDVGVNDCVGHVEPSVMGVVIAHRDGFVYALWGNTLGWIVERGIILVPT